MPNSAFGHALVIGASSGIGERLARRLAADGTRGALVARREAELQRAMDEINAAAGEDRAVAVAHDVRDVKDIPELFLPRPSVLSASAFSPLLGIKPPACGLSTEAKCFIPWERMRVE